MIVPINWVISEHTIACPIFTEIEWGNDNQSNYRCGGAKGNQKPSLPGELWCNWSRNPWTTSMFRWKIGWKTWISMSFWMLFDGTSIYFRSCSEFVWVLLAGSTGSCWVGDSGKTAGEITTENAMKRWNLTSKNGCLNWLNQQNMVKGHIFQLMAFHAVFIFFFVCDLKRWLKSEGRKKMLSIEVLQPPKMVLPESSWTSKERWHLSI